jgi:hypothetical protein
MDHHQQHREHHQNERERRIEHEKEAEGREEKEPRSIHPAWLVGLGGVFIVIIILGWTLLT